MVESAANAADVPEGDKRRHGYSRDKRPDCPQVVIALVVIILFLWFFGSGLVPPGPGWQW